MWTSKNDKHAKFNAKMFFLICMGYPLETTFQLPLKRPAPNSPSNSKRRKFGKRALLLKTIVVYFVMSCNF